MKTIVISVGGSVLIPDKFDVKFVRKLGEILSSCKDKRFIVICGGGKLARDLQENAKKIKGITNNELDWIGIYATRINALTLKKILGVKTGVITNPLQKIKSNEKVVVAAGWKPGFSTDYDAVLLANNVRASFVINVTNVDYIYDKNPKLPGAKHIKKIKWKDLRKLVGNKWKPGLNMPFDPIAAKKAMELKLAVAVMGKDLKNLSKAICNKEFRGTLIT